jgi:hypothetical protein
MASTDTLERWYSDAEELAVSLLCLRQWRWHSRTVPTFADESQEQRRESYRQANRQADARVDATLRQLELLETKTESLETRFAEVWPGLKLAYCDLGDFVSEGLPAGRCAWVALKSLAEKVVGWGRYLANEQQTRTLNCAEEVEHQERERWLSKAVDAIRARLLLEESKLLQQNPRPAIAEPSKKTISGVARRRRRSGEQKLTSQWHEISANGKDVLFNKQKLAIRCREVEREFGIPPATASEQFKKIWGSHKDYAQKWARNPQGLAYQLATLNGEVFCCGESSEEQFSESETED